MEIIFEDSHLLVLNKPAGLLTQPSGTAQPSLEEAAKAWLKAVYHKPGNVFLEAAHRLDKPVSGIVLFAKRSKALARLHASMRAHQARKVYWAWVEGAPTSEQGELEHFLFHDDFQAVIVPSDHPGGKVARLSYRLLERRKDRSLLAVTLETGRYHQIRLQLAAMGCPVWGDIKYGSSHVYSSEGIALHHQCLEIPHPMSKAWMVFNAPPPSAFIALGGSGGSA